MAKPGIHITGHKQTIRALRRLDAKVQRKVVRAALKKGAVLIEAEAKQTAPVDTGQLRDNIKVRSGKSRKGVVRLEVRVGDRDIPGSAWHGAAVEFGTEDMTARPFLGPAADAVGPRAGLVAATELARGIDRESRKASFSGRVEKQVKRLKKTKAYKGAKRARKATLKRVKKARKAIQKRSRKRSRRG